MTHLYSRRNIANFTKFLSLVEAWIDLTPERIYVILDNLTTHQAYDVLLFSLVHARFGLIFNRLKRST